jgi:hypothetical protein
MIVGVPRTVPARYLVAINEALEFVSHRCSAAHTFPLFVFSIPLPKTPFLSYSRYGTPTESSRFQAFFEPALQAYEKKTGISLARHPLAIKLQNTDSVEAIVAILQDQAQAFRDFQGSDKIMRSLKATVSILSKLSSAASLVDAFGPVRQQELVACFTPLTGFLQILPPAKAIQACIAILLDVRAVPSLRFI